MSDRTTFDPGTDADAAAYWLAECQRVRSCWLAEVAYLRADLALKDKHIREMADKYAAQSAVLSRAAERRPDPFADLLTWRAADPWRKFAVECTRPGGLLVTLTDARIDGWCVSAGGGTPWCFGRACHAHVPDGSDLAAIVRVVLAVFATLDREARQ